MLWLPGPLRPELAGQSARAASVQPNKSPTRTRTPMKTIKQLHEEEQREALLIDLHRQLHANLRRRHEEHERAIQRINRSENIFGGVLLALFAFAVLLISVVTSEFFFTLFP